MLARETPEIFHSRESKISPKDELLLSRENIWGWMKVSGYLTVFKDNYVCRRNRFTPSDYLSWILQLPVNRSRPRSKLWFDTRDIWPVNPQDSDNQASSSSVGLHDSYPAFSAHWRTNGTPQISSFTYLGLSIPLILNSWFKPDS